MARKWVAAVALLVLQSCSALPWDFVNLAETLGSMYEFGAGGLPGKVFAVLGESASDRGPMLQIARHLRYPVLCIDIEAALKRRNTPAEAATDVKRWLVNHLTKPSMISVSNAHKIDGSTLEALNFLHEVTDSSNSVIHYTDPATLETYSTSTKGSIFVLHFELPASHTCHKDELYGLWQDAVQHRTSPDALYGRIEDAFCAEHPKASISWQGSCDHSYPSKFGFDGTPNSTATLITAAVVSAVILVIAFLALRPAESVQHRGDVRAHYTMAARDDAPEPPEYIPTTPPSSSKRSKQKAATMPAGSPRIERPVTRSQTKPRRQSVR